MCRWVAGLLHLSQTHSLIFLSIVPPRNSETGSTSWTSVWFHVVTCCPSCDNIFLYLYSSELREWSQIRGIPLPQEVGNVLGTMIINSGGQFGNYNQRYTLFLTKVLCLVVSGRETSRGRQEVTITLQMWRQGFSINDGPLRKYNEPQNMLFLKTVSRG